MLLIASMVASDGASAQTVILVRHAEKAVAPAADPPLTTAGEARARALSDMLREARVTRVVTSPLRRTRDTAAPTAALARVSGETVAITGDISAHVAATAALIRTTPADGVVLVVGHSNTIPLIAAALGIVAPAPIPDCASDRVTVLTLGRTPPSSITMRYGTPSDCPG